MKTAIGFLLVAYFAGALAFALLASHYALAPPPATPVIGMLPDFSAIKNIKLKKTVFFEYFSVFVDIENARLREAREQLLSLQQKLEKRPALAARDMQVLRALSKKFAVPGSLSNREQLRELLLKVDEIPRALVLAQAANESAWGSSRFALEGNNYFGQWCFRKGCGLVPNGRSEGAGHEVRKFASPADSVAAYFHNINSHPAYRQLRAIRAQLRSEGQPLTGRALAEGLEQYSERGREYINELRRMMRVNRLEPRAPRSNPAAEPEVRPSPAGNAAAN